MGDSATLGDYLPAVSWEKFAYLAQVIKPGMTRAELEAAIVSFQTFSPPSVDEIKNFLDNFQIVASSGEGRFGFTSGLDALIVKDNGGNIFALVGGVGPTSGQYLTEGGPVAFNTFMHGALVSQYNDFLNLFNAANATNQSGSISLIGHSQGSSIATLFYGYSILQGFENRIQTVVNLELMEFKTLQ